MPIAGTGTAAETSALVKARLRYAVLLTEQHNAGQRKSKRSLPYRTDRIAAFRDRAIASILTHELAEIDPNAKYEFEMREKAPDLPYALIDLEMRPNMIVAEFIGRTEGALLLKALIRTNPSNQSRYVIKPTYGLEIQK